MIAKHGITLQDLVKVALGTPQLSNVNVAILQSLIEILLKKLNCENETVSLNAHDSKQLENILRTAHKSPMVFNDENIEKVADKLERLDELKESVDRMQDKLDRHLQAGQKTSNFNETTLKWENWPTYGCEHLCTTCDTENEIACELLNNTDFIKKLLRRMSDPIVERIFHFEEKIEKLNQDFSSFIERTQAEYLKIQLLERCIEEIEGLRGMIKDQQTQFLSAMEEIQDMLDSKMDKIHMPALKKYIRDNFQQIDQSINTLYEKRKCPRAAGIVMDGVRCLSCGNRKVCSVVGIQPTGMLPNVLPKPVKLRKPCGSSHIYKNSKKFKLSSWNLGDFVKIKRPKPIRMESNLPQCRKVGEDFELLQGSDGHLYRKG